MLSKIGRNEKLENLDSILNSFKSVIIAFSGGLDSSFLLWRLTQNLSYNNIIAITCYSETTPKQELYNAYKIAKVFGVKHLVIRTIELKCEDFINNDLLRCYYCKRKRFAFIKNLLKDKINPIILEGSQLDDLDDYRPGMQAVKELGIRSPLIEAKFTKDDIRTISSENNLLIANLKSESCLATRIKTGQPINEIDLYRIHKAEQYIKSLGISFIRVRVNNNEARLEVTNHEIEKAYNLKIEITNYLKKLSFDNISLDLHGYRSK